MADETGHTHEVGADDISRLLAEHRPLRLVVLNACDTGRGSASDAFSSTAAALIRREVPAVVAMQFQITDSAAIRFAQTFYQHVAKRRSVDDSVMRARRALRLAKNDTLEWGTPVLYLRAPDGRIFDDAIPPLPKPGPSPDPMPTPDVAATPPASQELPDPPAPPPAPPRVLRDSNAVLTLRHHKGVNAVAFSPDGRRLATASNDGTARVWDAITGQELLTVAPMRKRLWRNPERIPVWMRGVAFSPDGRRLATAGTDKTARIWDATSGQELVTVNHEGEVRWVVFSPDGRRLATASDRTARVWDATSGQSLTKVTHQATDQWTRQVTFYSVWRVVFSPDGRRLATAGTDKTARIWDATSGQQLVEVAHRTAVWMVAFSPDGNRLATASHDRTARIWDATSGQELVTVNHDGGVSGVVFSPDGRRLATASDDRTARVWVLSDDE